MDINEFRQKKETGELVSDADLQNEPKDVVIKEDEPEDDLVEDESEDSEEKPLDELKTDKEDIPELTTKEKTAFEKRMERELKKKHEQMEQEFEQKYSKHKEAIETLGGDPDKILNAARENRRIAEANRLAEQNGWDEDETKAYLKQARQDQEIKELRVQMQINKLKDNPDYAGISTMEKDILAKIDKSNGALSVDEAYWALGGHKKAEQLKLDAQMREIEKRKQTPRTVLTDTTTSQTAEKPLPADVMRDAERMGVSTTEARRLMSKEPAKNIDEWRERRKAK